MPAAPPSSGPTLSSGWYTGPTGLPVSGVDAAEGSGYLISSSGADGRQQWRGAGSGDWPLKPGPSDSGWVPGASQHGECRPGGRVCKSGWQMPLCSWNRITYGVRPQHPLAGLLAWDGSPASQPGQPASSVHSCSQLRLRNLPQVPGYTTVTALQATQEIHCNTLRI